MVVLFDDNGQNGMIIIFGRWGYILFLVELLICFKDVPGSVAI